MKRKQNKKVGAFTLDIDVLAHIQKQHDKGMNKSRLVNDSLRKQFKLSPVKKETK